MSKKLAAERFGVKLRILRLSRNLTMKELAQSLNLTAHGYISELEAGKKMPSIEFVLNVARFFDVTTDQLLKDELELKDLKPNEDSGEQG